MGNAHQLISKETFEELTEEVFFDHDTLDDLYRTFHRYSNAKCAADLKPKLNAKGKEVEQAAPPDPPAEKKKKDPGIWLCEASHMKVLRMEQFLSFKSVRASPFAPRLFSIFKDHPEGMTFESFVLLANAVHPRTPLAVKAMVAFRVFDFNCTAEIEEDDVVTALKVMTGLKDLWMEALRKHMARPDEPKSSYRWSNEDFPLRTTGAAQTETTVLSEAAKVMGRESKIDPADIEKALEAHNESLQAQVEKAKRDVDRAEDDSDNEMVDEELALATRVVPEPEENSEEQPEGQQAGSAAANSTPALGGSQPEAEGSGAQDDKAAASEENEGAPSDTEKRSAGIDNNDDDDEDDWRPKRQVLPNMVDYEELERIRKKARNRSLARAQALMPELELAVCKIGDRIFSCLDQDKSAAVSQVEFEKLVKKIPDFRSKFSFTFPS